jgi:hypothetical protein
MPNMLKAIPMPELPKAPQPLPNTFQFLFCSPLYAEYSCEVSSNENNLLVLFVYEYTLDGFCPYCKRTSTFSRSEGQLGTATIARMSDLQNFDSKYTLTCARNDGHVLKFHLRIDRGVIQKIGQYPSFADIAVDESKQYTKLLSKEDTAELHKAIGLAAHGVGIGAYVYIRRIFENLIHSRFDEWKDREGWKEQNFKDLRMTEKIEFLKNHLPPFLVKNKRLYGILSKGVHELDEDECLRFFPVIRDSTIFILDEDKRKKEELTAKAAIEQKLAEFEKTIKQED